MKILHYGCLAVLLWSSCQVFATCDHADWSDDIVTYQWDELQQYPGDYTQLDQCKPVRSGKTMRYFLLREYDGQSQQLILEMRHSQYLVDCGHFTIGGPDYKDRPCWQQ